MYIFKGKQYRQFALFAMGKFTLPYTFRANVYAYRSSAGSIAENIYQIWCSTIESSEVC